jgi:hypothetical protein
VQEAIFFLGSLPREGTPIKLNGNIAITCAILELVAVSATEGELGVIFLDVQEARMLRLMLHEMGHPQLQTQVHVDNATCFIIVNDAIKREQSCALEICYFWLLDQTTQQYINVYCHPGDKTMGNYPSKASTSRPYSQTCQALVCADE